MPNLFPNENFVVGHVMIFTASTTLWIAWVFFVAGDSKLKSLCLEEKTMEICLEWFYEARASYITWYVFLVVDYSLNFYTLFMLHKFSIFTGRVRDPITGLEIPVLSMFLNAGAMEQGMKDRVLSDKKRT